MESSDEEEVLEFVAPRRRLPASGEWLESVSRGRPAARHALHATDVADVSFGDIEKLLDKIERVQRDLELYDQR
jgi:hypothetical protein